MVKRDRDLPMKSYFEIHLFVLSAMQRGDLSQASLDFLAALWLADVE